jgi:hypothetical protein
VPVDRPEDGSGFDPGNGEPAAESKHDLSSPETAREADEEERSVPCILRPFAHGGSSRDQRDRATGFAWRSDRLRLAWRGTQSKTGTRPRDRLVAACFRCRSVFVISPKPCFFALFAILNTAMKEIVSIRPNNVR